MRAARFRAARSRPGTSGTRRSRGRPVRRSSARAGRRAPADRRAASARCARAAPARRGRTFASARRSRSCKMVEHLVGGHRQTVRALELGVQPLGQAGMGAQQAAPGALDDLLSIALPEGIVLLGAIVTAVAVGMRSIPKAFSAAQPNIAAPAPPLASQPSANPTQAAATHLHAHASTRRPAARSHDGNARQHRDRQRLQQAPRNSAQPRPATPVPPEAPAHRGSSRQADPPALAGDEHSARRRSASDGASS